MKRAFILMRDTVDYPREAALHGLQSLGYSAQFNGVDRTFNNKDLLVTWTPWKGSLSHRLGEQHKKNGGKWIVMENGYIGGLGKPYYAVGLNGFNGYGDHRNNGMSSARWESFGLPILPWVTGGDHLVVFAQMGGHDHRFTMPPNWPDDIIQRLRKITDKRILYRPKEMRPRYLTMKYENVSTPSFASLPISHCFLNAAAVIVYNSKLAVEAIRLGVPALYDGPVSILSSILQRGIEGVNNPTLPNREQFFYDVAYSQWNSVELSSGEPFQRLLS